MKRALFLDRDGTINIDSHYIRDPALVHFIPGAPAAIRRANEAGWLVVVVTNQSGVGRGFIQPAELKAVHARFDELLQQEGAHIDYWQICTHAPAENCQCRKPQPFLLLDVAKREGIDLTRSVMVGDRRIDVAAGRAAGCKTVMVRTGDGAREEQQSQALEQADATVADLSAAVEWALQIAQKS